MREREKKSIGLVFYREKERGDKWEIKKRAKIQNENRERGNGLKVCFCFANEMKKKEKGIGF